MGRRGPKARPLWERFNEKTITTDSGCVLWTAGTNGVGYGVIVTSPGDGSHQKLYVHRMAYERKFGPIPDGMHIDHLCRTRNCVNPDHMEPVTLEENVLRGMSPPACNARKSRCAREHDLVGANLYIHPTTGYRQCRACARIRDAKRKPRKRKAT